ncbi:hypothetical protein [Streptomyces johnsoniae]|uniref:Uncharacterized protein n=1 Tax=Streptomyces johnsoniae TaxID=3075532 RepID=A0ABU2S908_9ACTN|nr:hypothetical protein [Streptomyces sp. DSM 41886]MDT0445435.1 hypothetical protein [Streptomyces sp. DSM 41886]
MERLDAGLDEAARTELIDWLRAEYATSHGGAPLGSVAVCRLGPPHVDHILDLSRSIVHHYAPAEPMPEPFARARMLVRTGAYAWVEVFDDGHLLPVHADGEVVEMRRGSAGPSGITRAWGIDD